MNHKKSYTDLIERQIYTVNEIDESLSYTYANYLNWLFDDRVELIKGKIFRMSPAPSRAHQKISLSISLALGKYLEYKNCEVYYAPFDVRFPTESKADETIYTVLQPDICVVCDLAKLDDKGCLGAPDIVIEILSPGNTKKELLHKYQVYEEFGVKEYWVVSASDQNILVYTLDINGKFQPSKLFTHSEEITSSVLSGFVLKIDEVFEDEHHS